MPHDKAEQLFDKQLQVYSPEEGSKHNRDKQLIQAGLAAQDYLHSTVDLQNSTKDKNGKTALEAKKLLLARTIEALDLNFEENCE